VWLAAITLAAAALRLHGLGAQILGDDETHLLTVVVSTPLREIPATVLQFDFSIPMAMLMRIWSGWSPLGEWTLRALPLLAGCLTPALATVVARRFVPTSLALATGLVVAVHPMFIFYSRYVRPYAIDAALLLLVLALMDRWRQTRRARPLVLAAVLAALAAWFQPLALITVGLLFGGLLAAEPAGRRERRPGTIALAGLGTLALASALLSPALAKILRVMVVGKIGLGSIDADRLRVDLEVLAGLPSFWLATACAALVAAGGLLLARRLGRRSLLLLVPALGQPAAILLLRPEGVDSSQVLACYLFYVLAIHALLAVVALGSAARWAAARLPGRLAALATDRAGRWGTALLAGLWVAAGPYPEIYNSHNAFAHHNVFQTFRYRDDPYYAAALSGDVPAPVHPYYETIAAAGEAVPLVVEWPATLEWPLNYLYLAQARHRRPVKLLADPGERWYVDERLDLGNVLDLAARESWRLEPGTVVILHRNPMVEQVRYMLGRTLSKEPRWNQRLAFDRTRGALAEALGPPVFEDDLLTVFRIGDG